MRPLRTTWKSTPGNFDPLHTLTPLWSDNEWGIPVLDSVQEPKSFDWSQTFDAVRTVVRRKRPLPDGLGLVTFFTDDYRFEQLWTSPDRFLGYMPKEHWALTPDFSLYTDHPAAVHLWNIFRSRWLGAYWASKGLNVIPTVSWAEKESYSYCFEGLPVGSVLAVSSVGALKSKRPLELWKAGFLEMVLRLTPVQVICCGNMPTSFDPGVPVSVLKPFQAKFGAK